MNFGKSNVSISGRPEFKITEHSDGGTVKLAYGIDRYIRFHWNRRHKIEPSLDFNLFGVKGSFKEADVKNSGSSANSGSSYGGIVIFSER